MTVLDQTKLRQQIERLAASAEFARADRMVQFLRYVVEKTLSGDIAALRERQIGISVFERLSDWDPKLDNIVRSEARRLRGKLEAYAASGDPDETVRITMPIGGYGVHFEELYSRVPPPQQDTPYTAQVAPDFTKPTERPSGRLLGSIAWFVLIGVVCLLSVLVGVLHYRSKVRVRAYEYEIEPFSSEEGLQFSPAISPDNRTIAFVWNGAGHQFDIYSKSIGSTELLRLTQGALPSIHPAWSPDGKQLAFLREAGAELPLSEAGGDAQLIVFDTVTHRERLIHRMQDSLGMWGSSNPLAGCQTLSWSPRGDQIILTDPSREEHGLISISALTGEQKTISRPGGSDQDCYSRLSPDGKTIAFVRLISHAFGYMYTVDVAGNHLNRLTREVKDLRGLDWTPDGSHLAFAAKEGGVYQLRMISAQGGESIPLPAATASASDPFVSPNGKFIAFVESHENWNIWRVPIKEGGIGKPQRFLASAGQNHSPSFSPDGRTIAFVSDRSGNPEIWLCDSDGQHLRQLTRFGGPWLGTIRWSPDGSSIVFDARPEEFHSLLTLILERLHATHQKEKLKMFGDALANSGSSDFKEDDTEQYIRTLRDLSLEDLQLLKAISAAKQLPEPYRNLSFKESAKPSVARLVGFGLVREVHGLKKFNLSVPVVPTSSQSPERYARGLADAFSKYFEQAPLTTRNTSDFGERFLDFISAAESGDIASAS